MEEGACAGHCRGQRQAVPVQNTIKPGDPEELAHLRKGEGLHASRMGKKWPMRKQDQAVRV